jgi:ABC-type phosphate/phosphonate transport system substrate-binding protein
MKLLDNSLGIIHGSRLQLPDGLRPRMVRCCIPVLLAAMFSLLFIRIAYAEQGEESIKILRSGFLSRIFSGIDIRDAQVTLDILTREISRNMGLTTTPRVIIYPGMAAMTDAIRHGELDIISMPTVEYLRIRDTVPLIPSFVGAHNNGMGSKYILVVRRDSGIQSFSELKGKTIFLPEANRHEESQVWLDVLLMKDGKANRNAFFSRVKEYPRVSHAIMGVFFRKANSSRLSPSHSS